MLTQAQFKYLTTPSHPRHSLVFYELYPQWRHKIENGRRMGGTLMFSNTGTYGENYWIGYNLLEKEDMAV